MCLLQALKALDRVFASDMNSKGFKLIRGAGVIQGDGINIVTIGKILDAVVAAGFSAQNVAFGMGGGLLQRVNRYARGVVVCVCGNMCVRRCDCGHTFMPLLFLLCECMCVYICTAVLLKQWRDLRIFDGAGALSCSRHRRSPGFVVGAVHYWQLSATLVSLV